MEYVFLLIGWGLGMSTAGMLMVWHFRCKKQTKMEFKIKKLRVIQVCNTIGFLLIGHFGNWMITLGVFIIVFGIYYDKYFEE